MNIRKETTAPTVYARQKAEGGIYCYFSTPKYCLTFEELYDHAVYNHEAVKTCKGRVRSAGQFRSSLLKHTSDLRIHSLAIIRRSQELRFAAIASRQFTPALQALYKAVEKQTDRTYKLKT
jgi:hypothetical protein